VSVCVWECVVLISMCMDTDGLRHFEEYTELVQQPVLKKGDVLMFTEVMF
jgi:hypothetical protein